MSLKNLAKNSPGLAAAAFQSNASPENIDKLNKLVYIQNIHNTLIALPQNDAYAKYMTYDKNVQGALADLYDPKYTQQDKGFWGNAVRGLSNTLRSATHYGGTSTWGLVKQVLTTPAIVTAAAVHKSAGEEVLKAMGNDETGIGKILATLVRPQDKLIKQPIAAAQMYESSPEAEGKNPFQLLMKEASFYKQGFSELLPGGKDLTTEYKGGGIKQYWAATSDPENAFIPDALVLFEPTLDPSVKYLAKMLAQGKSPLDNYDDYKNNPAIVSLIANYVSGDEEVGKTIDEAVQLYNNSRPSLGRGAARGVIVNMSVEEQRKKMGDTSTFSLFNAISGPIDTHLTIALDPLLLLGKANKVRLAAKYAIIKNGVFSGESLAVAIEKYPRVARYFGEAGKLVNTYKTGAPEESALAYTRLRKDFKEISPTIIDDMHAFGVKDVKTAVQFFQGQDDIANLVQGIAIMERTPLLPRYSKANYITDKFKNYLGELTTNNYRNLDVPGAKEDFGAVIAQDPATWAYKIGVKEGLAFGKEGDKSGIFTLRDKSIIGRVDRFMRAFEIAPKAMRNIVISDASSADQIFAMVRAAGVDKTSASLFRTYWISADEGQRLTALKAVLKTHGRAFGLEHATKGRELLDSIDNLSAELYSVSQDSINLGSINATAGIINAENIASPNGIRKIVQDASRLTTAEGKAGRVNASLVAEMSALSAERKALGLTMKELKQQQKLGIDVTNKIQDVKNQLNILGARWAKLNKARVGVKGSITDGELPADLDKFNAAEINGTQRAIRVYQLNTEKVIPDLMQWREAATRAGVVSKVTGDISNNKMNKMVVDMWSFNNLYPRLGIRTTVDEVGSHLFINGLKGFGEYINGRAMSRALRVNKPLETKTRIKTKKGFLKEVEKTNLGIVYNNLYKLLGKTKTQDELLALANDPEKLGDAVAESMLNNRFKPSFLKTKFGQQIAEYAKDYARFNGATILEDALGNVSRGDVMLSKTDDAIKGIEQFGPSIALNVNLQEALKGFKFKGEFTEWGSQSENFANKWLLELNNTVGKRNGQFGNIVLWNAHRPQSEVVEKLFNYIEGEGNELARRFAAYNELGAYRFAEHIYADATYALRDSAGRINNKLVNAIRDAGGVDKFSIYDLAKIDKPYARPNAILGQELIPIEQVDAPNIINRIMTNGYDWIGKQIALLDREPITYGNYIMYRDMLSGQQKAIKESMLKSGASEELADSAARLSVNDLAATWARSRTLAFVDNADVRTNLAYSMKTFGRYYRATEDFWRRLSRIIRKEPEALVRLAIANQGLEDSGFIHEDDKGQMYFTYPGADFMHDALNVVLSEFFGIEVKQPSPVSYGGYVKMLTPSLDPQSAPPRISGPISSIGIAVIEQIPYVGDFVKKYETVLTGGYNPDAPLWRKVLPTNVLRILDIAIGGDENQDARFSSAIKAGRMLVSTGNGPQTPAETDKFSLNMTIQAINVQLTKLIFGQGAVASVQTFENTTVPENLLEVGVFTWNSEFVKFMERYPNDANAYSKALVDFATIYPSKLAFTVSGTDAEVQANFQKTYEAADFVKNNKKLFLEHKEGASFFIPINGTNDYQSYNYLKSNGFLKNKNVEDYIYQIATANVRKAYYAITDEFNAKIAATNDPTYKAYLRQDLTERQRAFKTTYPLLPKALGQGETVDKVNALNDLRDVIVSGKAPKKDLATKFYAMISAYDAYERKTNGLGSSGNDSNYKNYLQADLKDTLVTLAGTDPNAQSLYNTLLEPLIGD